MTQPIPFQDADEPARQTQGDLVKRLRGEYRIPITDGLGPAGGEEPDNSKEFVRRYPTCPIQLEAADRIEALEALLLVHRCNTRADLSVGECVREGLCACSCGLLLKHETPPVAAAQPSLKLIEALQFYAEPENWNADWENCELSLCESDRGYIARSALETAHELPATQPSREAALVKAGKPLIEGLEDLPAEHKAKTWVFIRDLQALRKALRPYDTPATPDAGREAKS